MAELKRAIKAHLLLLLLLLSYSFLLLCERNNFILRLNYEPLYYGSCVSTMFHYPKPSLSRIVAGVCFLSFPLAE